MSIGVIPSFWRNNWSPVFQILTLLTMYVLTIQIPMFWLCWPPWYQCSDYVDHPDTQFPTLLTDLIPRFGLCWRPWYPCSGSADHPDTHIFLLCWLSWQPCSDSDTHVLTLLTAPIPWFWLCWSPWYQCSDSSDRPDTQVLALLTNLDLSDNHIVHLPMNILHKMKHLKHLHLQVFKNTIFKTFHSGVDLTTCNLSICAHS